MASQEGHYTNAAKGKVHVAKCLCNTKVAKVFRGYRTHEPIAVITETSIDGSNLYSPLPYSELGLLADS